MKNISVKIFFVSIALVVTLGFVSAPKTAEAIGFVDWVNAALQAVGHSIQGVLLGIDSVANTIDASLSGIREIVNGLPIEYGPTRRALALTATSCDLIGGDLSAVSSFQDLLQTPTGPEPNTGLPDSNLPTVANAADSISVNPNSERLSESLSSLGDTTKANMILYTSKKLGILRYRQTCYKVFRSSMLNSLTLAAWNEQLKQAMEDTLKDIEPKMNSINGHVAGLEEQMNAAKRELFSAIATSVAIQINEQDTEETLNQVSPKLTISNYQEAKDALVKLIYAPRIIKEKYESDKTTQLIMTALLNAEISKDQSTKNSFNSLVDGLIQAKKTLNCPQTVQLYDYSQDIETLGTQVANYLQPQCFDLTSRDGYESDFQKILESANIAADNELNNGGGVMSVRACIPTTDAEKQKLKEVTDLAQKVIESGSAQKSYEQKGMMRDPGYITAVQNSKTNSEKLVQAAVDVQGGISEQCTDIQTAGSIAKASIENYLKQRVDQNTAALEKYPQNAGQYSDGIRKFLFGTLLTGNVQNPKNLLTSSGLDLFKIISQPNSVAITTSSANKTVDINNSQIQTYQPSQSSSSSAAPAGHTSSSTSSGSTGTPSVKGDISDYPLIPYASPRGAYGLRQ